MLQHIDNDQADISINFKHVKYFHVVFVFILTFIVASTFSTIGVDTHHDGFMFKPALDVANGKILFKDTFTQYGALTTFLQAMAIRIFGEYLIVIKILTAFFYAMISVLLWLIWSRFLPTNITTISCLIWLLLAPYYELVFHPWSSVYALFFLLLSTYGLFLNYEKQKSLYLVASGASAALTFWCRQPVGIFLLLALVLIICSLQFWQNGETKHTVRDVVLVLLGYFIVCAGFLTWLGINNALHDWYLQSIEYAFAWGRKYGGDFGFSSMFQALLPYSGSAHDNMWLLLPVSGFVLLIRLVVRWVKNNKFSKDEILFYSFLMVAFSSWLQYYPMSEIRHRYWAAAPLVGVLVYAIWSLSRYIKTPYRYPIFVMGLLLVFYNDISDRLTAGFYKLDQNYITISKPKVLRWMKVAKSDADIYEGMSNLINDYELKHPDKEVILSGGDPLYLTFAINRSNFHPLYVPIESIYLSVYPDFIDKRYDFVNKQKPIIISHYGKINGFREIATYSNGYSILVPSE
jgi:hypothetical protein